jgi:hypothetical protein
MKEADKYLGSGLGKTQKYEEIHLQTHTCIISFYLFTNEIY